MGILLSDSPYRLHEDHCGYCAKNAPQPADRSCCQQHCITLRRYCPVYGPNSPPPRIIVSLAG